MEDAENLREMSITFDRIFDIPAEAWSIKEVKMYNLLKSKIDKYNMKYCLCTFKLDVIDITNNIKAQDWYKNHKNIIDNLLQQMTIKSYQKSSKTTNFKVIARFTKLEIQLTISRTDDKFSFILANKSIQTDLNNFDDVAKIFNITSKDKKLVVLNIVKLIEEISIFYGSND